MNTTYLELLRQIKEDREYDLEKLEDICNEIEDVLGAAEMWNLLRPGFSYDELLENLEYIAKEADI